MSKRQIAELAFRILALYLFVAHLGQALINTPELLSRDEVANMKIFILSASVAPLIAAVLIWRFAGFLANRVSSAPAETDDIGVVAGEDLKSVAVLAIGVYLIASALPSILTSATTFAFPLLGNENFNGNPFAAALSQSLNAELISSVFRLIVGLGLLLGGERVLWLGRGLSVARQSNQVES